MADQIADECRQYVAENASSYDDQAEDQAIEAMSAGLHRHAVESGWDLIDFHVDVEAIVREGLRMHRDRS